MYYSPRIFLVWVLLLKTSLDPSVSPQMDKTFPVAAKATAARCAVEKMASLIAACVKNIVTNTVKVAIWINFIAAVAFAVPYNATTPIVIMATTVIVACLAAQIATRLLNQVTSTT